MKLFLTLFLNLAMVHLALAQPDPYGATPSPAQVAWHQTEMYAIVHFTPTTFENKEWGFGDADPKIFNPVGFDANQIVKTAKQGGLKGIIFVAKHHDGFCLWPTKTTPYNISKSPWRNGKGDMVKEMEQACRKANMKFGVYCSPWDRNHPKYGDKAYVDTYREQLRELYTQYGELFMSWHDGANGGDGYYGGAKETRKIDNTTYYGWDFTWGEITRKLQPKACIFSDIGLDVRWVGNEKGHANEVHYATFTPMPETGQIAVPGNVNTSVSSMGTLNGKYWIPAECDVPLRPGWFYHPEQDDKVKQPEQLFELYLKSVGRGACLDLGLAPTPEGIMHKNDVAALKTFGLLLKKRFKKELSKKAIFSTTNGVHDPKLNTLIDNNLEDYWLGKTQNEIIIDFKKSKAISYLVLQEYILLGQRIDKVKVEIEKDGTWVNLAEVATVGAKRIIALPEGTQCQKMKISIEAPVAVCLSKLAAY